MKKDTSKGFGLIGILLVLVVIAAIGFGGWAVYHKEHNSTVKQTPSSKKAKTTSSSKPTTNTSTPTNTTTPVLGITWKAGLIGFGRAKPTEISLGGDPTSIAMNITWQSWGGAEAIGTGVSTYVAPSQTTSEGSGEQATIVAFNLGTCNGVPAYNAIEWYFPQYGQTFNSSPGNYWNACTGVRVSQ